MPQRTVSIPQRSGVLSDPIVYEAVAKIVSGVNMAMTLAGLPSQPVSAAGTLNITNPVVRLTSGGTIQTIGPVDFSAPIFLIASVADVELVTGGNIGGDATISAGSAGALVLDVTTGIWWPITGGGIPGITAAGLALLDDVDAAAQRTTLGLGSVATMSAVEAKNLPTSSVTTSRSIATSDAGAMLLVNTSGALTFDNTESCQIGDQITLLRSSPSSATITQGTGRYLYVSGSNSAGNRTLAAYSICAFIKLASDSWTGWGAGLS